MDSSAPQSPNIVHGFLPRDADGYQIVDTWGTLGMRARQSQDTVLDNAFVPDERVALVCPPGFGGAGPFHVAIFAWALTGSRPPAGSAVEVPPGPGTKAFWPETVSR